MKQQTMRNFSPWPWACQTLARPMPWRFSVLAFVSGFRIRSSLLGTSIRVVGIAHQIKGNLLCIWSLVAGSTNWRFACSSMKCVCDGIEPGCFRRQVIYIYTRWAPTSYKWSYGAPLSRVNFHPSYPILWPFIGAP